MTQRNRTQRLAMAFKRLERQQDKLLAEIAAFEIEFGKWASGRSIDRVTARRHLVSTGYLEARMEKR